MKTELALIKFIFCFQHFKIEHISGKEQILVYLERWLVLTMWMLHFLIHDLHPFSRYWMSICWIPGPLPGFRNTAVNKSFSSVKEREINTFLKYTKCHIRIKAMVKIQKTGRSFKKWHRSSDLHTENKWYRCGEGPDGRHAAPTGQAQYRWLQEKSGKTAEDHV